MRILKQTNKRRKEMKREELVAKVGEESVAKLDDVSCELDGLYNREFWDARNQNPGDDPDMRYDYKASLTIETDTVPGIIIEKHYLPTCDEVIECGENGNGDMDVDWENCPVFYEIYD
jgi:hypothetical protein